MKMALVQPNTTLGDVEGNLAICKEHIFKAKKEGADLIVFPELMLTGYPPQDLLFNPSLIHACQNALEALAALTNSQFAVLLGAPAINPGKGKPFFNNAYFLAEGQIKQTIGKSLLPTYDVFDEDRYFEPANNNQLIVWKGQKIALAICEDSWNIEPQKGLYHQDVLLHAGAHQADVLINITASPFHPKQSELRHRMAHFQAKRFNIPFVYVNHCAAQTDLVFDGNSFVLNPNGNYLLRLASFAPDFQLVNPWETKTPLPDSNPEPMESIYQALLLGIRDYFKKNGFSKAVLGLSGGVDSALVALLAADALGPHNVHALLLPSKYSSDHSIQDALQLAKNLGISTQNLSIQEGVDSLQNSLENAFGEEPSGLTQENLQSRLRGLYLMAFSNHTGAVLLNTSNKSESAVGYGTLYGDMCGGLSVIGDLYKTQVYALCAFVNQAIVRIPTHILTKAPSAELRPNQKDSDSLPDYAKLDALLLQHIEEQKDAKTLTAEGFDSDLVKKVVNLVKTAEFKRFQAPPAIRVSPKAFGSGRRLPITAKLM